MTLHRFTTCCCACGRIFDEVKLLRQEKDSDMFWCEACVHWRITEAYLHDSIIPEWMFTLCKKFCRISMRQIPWRQRLLFWLDCCHILNKQYEKFNEKHWKMKYAIWHVWRYKLIYENEHNCHLVDHDTCKHLRAVRVEGLEVIAEDKKIRAVRDW